jgi:hypothetical protein
MHRRVGAMGRCGGVQPAVEPLHQTYTGAVAVRGSWVGP